MTKKEIIINSLGVFYITYGVFAMEYAVHRGKPVWALWFCYVALIVIGFGMLAKNSMLIASQLNAVSVSLIIWNIDFFSRIFTDQHWFGTTKYFFSNSLLLPARLISLEHF